MTRRTVATLTALGVLVGAATALPAAADSTTATAGTDAATSAAAAAGTDRHVPRGAGAADHVVLVDWDGFDPDYLGRAPTPNLDALAARGSLSIGTATYQTVSNPVRASIVTGAKPDRHENAAYYFDGEAGVARGQERHLEAETLAEALAEAGRTVASVQWYMVQDHGTSYGDPEHLYVQPGGDFGDRVDVAVDILHQRPVDSDGARVTVPRIPDLLAVYASDLDGLGHGEGAESPGIGPLLAEMDADLGRLVQATRDVGIFERTAFVLVSDHGMTSWNRTLLPQVQQAIRDAGFVPEVVTPGASPAPETEVVIVPNPVRYGDLTLRGAAATPAGRRAVVTALRSLHPTYVARIVDEREQHLLRTSDKLGDLLVEAAPPYGFALSEPPEGEWRGSHGSTQERHVPILLAGAGVRAGRQPVAPGVTDLAPTIARLLGVAPPDHADGRVLAEVLAPTRRWASPARP